MALHRKSAEMDYPTLKAPFELNFREMPRVRAREFLAWFIEQIPNRIMVLTQYVKQTPNYRSWKDDLTPASLASLGEWFCQRVEVRTKSTEEISAMNLPAWLQQIAPVEIVLTNMTMNLVVDMAMYFAQTIRENNHSVHWDLATKPRSSADFQQPVLLGQGRRFLNPVRVLRVYAYGIADKSQGPERLGELYTIWSRTLTE